jgi:O-antigen ligase
MTLLSRSLKPIATQGVVTLFNLRKYMIGLVVVGLGAGLGYLLNSPVAFTTVSVLIILSTLLIAAYRPFYAVLIWLALDSFVETWVKIPMGRGIPDLSFSRFLIAFLVAFLLARGAIGKFRFARLNLTDLCIIAAPLGIMASAPLIKDSKGVILYAIAFHLTPMMIYFFAKNLVRSQNDLNKLLWVITLLGVVSAAYGIYELTTGHVLFVAQTEDVNNRLAGYTASLKLIRGYVGSANIGRILTYSIPISFYLFFETKNLSRKGLLIGLLAIQAYGIFLTYNRTSWYALLISLALIQFFYPQFRKAFWVIAIVVGVVLFITKDQVNESTVVQDRINSKVSTLEGRQGNWDAGYRMWQARPLQGWGFGQYELKSGQFRTDGKNENFSAIENDYLHILVATGLIGFLPVVIFQLVPLVNSIPLFFKARASPWPGFIKWETIIIFWAIMVSFVLGSYTQVQTQAIVKMIPFAVAGAVIGSHEYLLRRTWTNPLSSPTWSDAQTGTMVHAET